MTRPVDVLAVGAHPDDAEVGCGGTLILASDAGLRVAVADLTLGEAATSGSAEERDAERRRAAEVLGLVSRPGLGLPDGGLGTDPGHRTALVELVRELRPRVVLAPYPDDRHPDHAAAGRLAREASFLAGLGRLGEGRAHRPLHVFHYLLHYPVPPSFVVDVSSVWSRRQDAIRAHASQFGGTATPASPSLARFLEVTEARATLHGAMIGAEHGEGFHYPGPVPLTALPGLAGDDPAGAYHMFH